LQEKEIWQVDKRYFLYNNKLNIKKIMGVKKMKPSTKKMIVTIINIVIFIGNAIISQLGNGVDGSTVATIGSAVAMGIALV